MDKQVLFKTSVMGGFNKTEVLTYIDELSSSSKEMEKRLGDKIAELEASNQQLGEDIAAVNEKMNEAQSRLEIEQARVRELTVQLSEASLDMAKYKQLCEEKDREIKIQREQNRQLQFKAESAEYKSKKYDEMSQQIGDALIDAKEKADQILADAKVQSKGILHSAAAAMESFSGQMVYVKEDVARIRDTLHDTVEQMHAKLDALDSMIDKAAARITLTSANVEAEEAVGGTQTSEEIKEEENPAFFRDAATL
ncbi:hypothetical protein [Zongyangia hominis]|uniref:Uncharacterized protein n=1 Tax=Zongyangia hominis TaxID=2763677 RepID=A0A926EBN3_9FIRM|nr:hypothetical protein [Zongyangia hominis]MBC8570100.1 hypothetical protein [Zongyangia hominis]